MTRGRLSISLAMGIVLVVAVGLAALKDPSKFWASAVFTSAVVVLLTSLLGAVARCGKSRMAWFGSVLFGGFYLILSFGPWPWLNNDGLRPPPILTTALLEKLKEDGGPVSKNWETLAASQRLDPSGPSPGPADLTIRSQGVTEVATGKRSIQAFVVVRLDISPYKQIAHSIGTILSAALGAWLGLAFASRDDRES